jgi:hypothetical protein
MTNDQRSPSLCLTALRLTARLALVPAACVLLRKALRMEQRAHQRHGVGRLVHLEDAELPLHEGGDPPVAELSENEVAPSPASARLFSATRADSSWSWREEWHRPCHQESAFSLRTLPV